MIFIPRLLFTFAGVVVFLSFLTAGIELEGERLPNQGICGRKDIRNNVRALEDLRNCSIIVGALHIVLMEGATDAQISAYSFPELREVTQYVLFYKIHGLRSLGQLFPNLVLIRGQKLFMNFSFIIHHMMDLEEIGLKSLMMIQRGAVRIDRNSKLCYVRSISWEVITGLSVGHYFTANGPSMCPGSNSCRGCDDNMCWNSKICQRFPSPTCPKECLAGCSDDGELCNRCKDFIYNGSCVAKCPEKTYLYPDANHCISKQTCNRMFRNGGWTWNNTCIHKCPKGYSEGKVNDVKTCVLCDGKCNVVCDGSEVTSISEAQHYKGCTSINGSLQIRFMGNHSNVMSELEEFFGDIEEIKGYLKVYRSIAITSLSFFKSLRIIHAEELEYGRFALTVHEMNNLQYLWNWNDSRKLIIKRGTISFHYNAKLCKSEIEALKNMTNVVTNHYDVSTISNGYKMTCHLVDVVTESVVIDKNSVMITWERPVQNADKEYSLGYLIYYLENPDDDVSTDFGRDACFEHGWKNYFYPDPTDPLITKLSHNISDLTPSTKYAYYVETYNSATVEYIAGPSGKHGQSVIKFFTTSMAVPSMPMNVLTASYQPDSISIFWKVDPNYKGEVKRHLIELYIQLDNVEHYDQRNYCEFPLNPPPKDDVKTINLETLEEEIEESEQNCSCPGIKPFWEIMADETDVFYGKIDYGGPIECTRTNTTLGKGKVYDMVNELKCNDLDERIAEAERLAESKNRVTRNVDSFPVDMMQHGTTNPRPVLQNVTLEDYYHYFSTDFRTTHKNYTAYKLKPFTKYMIYFALCMGDNPSDCGPVAINVQRTKKNSTRDAIKDLQVTVLNSSAAEVHWKEPVHVNGVILTYTIEYKSVEVNNFKPILECITRKQHEVNNFTFLANKLLPGKYSVRVRPTSLSGDGNFTDVTYFVITESIYHFNWGLFMGICTGLFVGGVIIYYFYTRRKLICPSLDDTDILIQPPDYSRVLFAGDDDENEATVDLGDLF